MKKMASIMALALFFLIFALPLPIRGETGNSPAEAGDEDIYNHFRGMEKAYQGPLPWDNDPRFIEAAQKNNTPVLMAAYRATLPDPILAEGYNIGLAAEQLAGKVVKTGEIFSQNDAIGPYTEGRGYRAGPTYAGNTLVTTVGGGVCKIATMLYNVVTFSDLKVVMRYAHSMTVPYVPPGQDATVYYGARDFRFENNSSGPVLIWAQKDGDTLYMALYGQKKPPGVTWHHKVIKRTKYWTLNRYNGSLAPGREEVVSPGQDGYIVRSWVTVEYPDGTVVSKKKGISYYNAAPRILEQGKKAGFVKNMAPSAWKAIWR